MAQETFSRCILYAASHYPPQCISHVTPYYHINSQIHAIALSAAVHLVRCFALSYNKNLICPVQARHMCFLLYGTAHCLRSLYLISGIISIVAFLRKNNRTHSCHPVCGQVSAQALSLNFVSVAVTLSLRFLPLQIPFQCSRPVPLSKGLPR